MNAPRSPIGRVGTIAELRTTLDEVRAGGGSIGFVPTMGYLHDGHTSLISAARSDVDAAGGGLVVASIFVNPLQFAPDEDLEDYPRDLERDAERASAAGADLLFVPSVEEMYPVPVLTTVSVAGVSEGYESGTRPTHFAGVATVVAKLCSIVGLCRAYFGEKDYQQLAVVRRMVDDLSMPVEVVGCQTVREPDGLAMSSRNVYLTDEERPAATVLHRALCSARAVVLAGETSPVEIVALMERVVAAEPLGALDYCAVVDARDLTDLTTAGPRGGPLDLSRAPSGDLRLLIAVRFGAARLIDNLGVTAPAPSATEPTAAPTARS